VLVGRDEVIAQAAAALRSGRSVLLCGERGSGRTAVASEVGRQLGRPVRRGSGLRLVDEPLLALSTALRVDCGGGTDAAAVSRMVADGLLLIDDLQWCDAATHELVAQVSVGDGVLATCCDDVPATDALRNRLGAAGWLLLELAPLDDDIAADLSADPQLRRLAGGNPGLLAHLVAGGAAAPGIRRLLGDAVARLSAEERRAVALVALAERPVPRDALSDAADALLARAVLREDGAGLRLRTPLLGDVVLAGEPAEVMSDLHRAVAGMLAGDPLAKAQHLAAAGDATGAVEAARAGLAATNEPLARRSLLELLVTATSPPQPQDLVALVLAEVACGQWTQALAHAAALEPDSDPRLAAAAARAARAVGDLARAADYASRIGSSAHPAAARVRLTRGELVGQVEGDSAEATLVRAVDALSAGQPAVGDLRAAVERAAAEGDWDVECAAWGGLAVAAALTGDRGLLAQTGTAARERCALAPSTAWRTFGAALDQSVRLHMEGAGAEALSAMQALLDSGAGPAWFTGQVGLALADLGRGSDAVQLIGALGEPTSALDGALQRWAAAECELTAARPRRALRLLSELPTPTPLRAASELSIAWANWWVRGPVAAPSSERGPAPVRAEHLGLLARAGGAHAEAAAAFEQAAGGWTGLSDRAQLRCRWAEADALLAAGDEAAGVSALREVESRAADRGQLPMQALARESLRRAGVRLRRAAAVATSTDSGLSTREYEVMALVKQGLTSAQVAAKLGVATSTVETQVTSAIRKLGAANRRQAALLLDTAGVR
jgi:DNA-binding CsgD family transcriptional regulator